MARPAARQRGLTLMELMVAVAIVAVLASLAVPSFGAQRARNHLKAAAERLAGDLAEARFEATRRGTTLHLHFERGTDWCYAVAAINNCGCGAPQPCQVRQVHGHEHKGVVLEQAVDHSFDPTSGMSSVPASVLLRSAHGETLRVELSRLGRAKVCAPGSPTLGYASC